MCVESMMKEHNFVRWQFSNGHQKFLIYRRDLPKEIIMTYTHNFYRTVQGNLVYTRRTSETHGISNNRLMFT